MTYHVYYTVLGNEEYTKVASLDEPSIVPVRQNCPIMLDEEDNNDELIIKIEQYLLRQSFVYDLAE